MKGFYGEIAVSECEVCRDFGGCLSPDFAGCGGIWRVTNPHEGL